MMDLKRKIKGGLKMLARKILNSLPATDTTYIQLIDTRDLWASTRNICPQKVWLRKKSMGNRTEKITELQIMEISVLKGSCTNPVTLMFRTKVTDLKYLDHRQWRTTY